MTIGEAKVKLIESQIFKESYVTTYGWYGDKEEHHPEERYTEWKIIVEAEGKINIGPYTFRCDSKKVSAGTAISQIEQMIKSYNRKDAEYRARTYPQSGIKKWTWEEQKYLGPEDSYYSRIAEKMAEKHAIETAEEMEKRGFKVDLEITKLEQKDAEKLNWIRKRKITNTDHLPEWAIDRYSRENSTFDDIQKMEARM